MRQNVRVWKTARLNSEELTVANKEEIFPEKIKTYLIRKYQYQQMTTPQTTKQRLKQSLLPPSQAMHRLQIRTLNAKNVKAKAFYSGGTGHRKIESRAKQPGEANHEGRQDRDEKPADPDKPKYNSKLDFHKCRYTGQKCGSAQDFGRREPKESSPEYGQVPDTKNSQEDSRHRRQDF